jgi:hypothetical protein
VVTQATGTAQSYQSYAASNATKLLSAGAYLESGYRRRVIHELLECRFRFVAPSYGYDAVTVLAHALVARSLARKQAWGVIASLVADVLLVRFGVISELGFALIAVWALWAFAFLRRVATLQALGRLRTVGASGGYPAHHELTPELAHKIAREQAGYDQTIFYGGYFPFVGAGWPLPDWSTAELLVPEQRDPLIAYSGGHDGDWRAGPAGPAGPAGDGAARATVIPFTVAEITGYVARELRIRLQDDALSGERIEHLTIERCRYSGASLAPVVRKRGGRLRLLTSASGPGGIDSAQPQSSRERYDATREYLCVRVGAWSEELVISMFVAFDLRGNTLYSEFHPCVLPPVQDSFHLVDRLPARLTPRLLLRVAWHVPAAFAGGALSVPFQALYHLRHLSLWGRVVVSLAPVADHSDFRLGRYATPLVDRGALASVRELAASPKFRHYFQEGDQEKYIKIVERQLLQVIGEFLKEHNVDLGDHDRNQTNIIDNSQSFRDFTISGGESFSIGGRGVRHTARTGNGKGDGR